MKVDAEICKVLHEAVERPAESYAEGLWKQVHMFLEQCESPIEQRLLCHLAVMALPFNDTGLAYPRPLILSAGFPLERAELIDSYIGPAGGAAFLLVQPTFGRYRLDFAVVARVAGPDLLRIAIECDGHAFHERTKQQAQADKSRDRKLTSAGFRIFRFTGSEIFRDVEKCAAEIEGFLFDFAYDQSVKNPSPKEEVAAVNG
jgi:very-short-patch-repair endonuclease